MAYEVRCEEDLNVAGCDLVARGETPADVLGQVIDHLEDEHDLTLPDPEITLEGTVDESTLTESVRIVVARLQEKLNISGEGVPGAETPPIATPRSS